MSDKVIYQAQGAIASIRLNRPERKNALDPDCYGQLADAIDRAEGDSAVRALVIFGGQGFFCSGNDVQSFLAAGDGDALKTTLRFMEALHGAAKPVVAAVSGPAIGIGVTLLLHCDLIVADATARFQLPFVRLGICPEFGAAALLPRIVGYQRAAEIMLLGEPIDAATALACGMINAVVESGLEAAALERAQRFAELPPLALRTAKAMLKKGLGDELPRLFREEIEQVARLMVSDEAREAFTAFMERRKPDFSKFS